MSAKTPLNPDGNKLVFLDGIRGIAAVYVMVGHARWLLWEGYLNFKSHPESYSFVDTALMYLLSLFRFGHEFVLLFFVLSGFVIHFSYSKKLGTATTYRLDWRQYFFRRLKRIYPPFLFALAFTFLLDQIGSYFGFSIYAGTTNYPSINTNVGNPNHEIPTLLGNLAFLYKEYFPVFGTNGPSWSLKFEWWFYMLYPAFFLLSRKHIYYSTALVIGLYVLTFYPALWKENFFREIFGSLICWWLGVVLAEVSTKRLNFNLIGFAAFTLVSCGLCYLLPQNSQNIDLRVGLLFTAILALLLWMNQKRTSMKLLTMLKPLGDFSYTLYIIHFPILVLMSGILSKYLGGSLPTHSYYIFVGIAVCIFVAYMVHFIVEVPFIKSKSASKANQIPKGEIRVLTYQEDSPKLSRK